MNNLSMLFAKNKPSLMMGLGIGSLIAGIFTAWDLSPMARDALEDEKDRQHTNNLSVKDTVMTVAPYVVPVAGLAVAGTAAVICANNMQMERQAAAMAACALSETTAEIYREKTREIVGEQKEKRIREAVAKEISDSHPANNIIVTGNGEFLCYDDAANQYFRANMTSIQKTINRVNSDMNNGLKVSLNEYCLALGLDETLLGNNLYWDVNETGLINPTFTAVLKGDEPCLVVSHMDHPPKCI